MSKIFYDDQNSVDSSFKESSLIKIDELTGGNYKLKDYLINHFKKLHETELYSGKWTNNNSESLNNVIKQEINWVPKKTEELIVKMRVLVDRKLLDLKKSLHSVGNWSLAQDFRRYAINNALWNAKSEEWQNGEFKKFLKDSKNIAKNEKMIGKKYKGLRIAKKPNQSKRPINERTK